MRDVAALPFQKLDGDQADFGQSIAGLAIDPFDANHQAYVTGATLYATGAFGTRGPMRGTPWTAGIEQTGIITLTSPTTGPAARFAGRPTASPDRSAPLISGFGDIAGFRHDDLGVSPPKVHTNPYLTNMNNLDYAGMRRRSSSAAAVRSPGMSRSRSPVRATAAPAGNRSSRPTGRLSQRWP